jgi:hypothetical protein
MNKSSYTKLFLTLAVGLNLLGGCEFPQEFETQNNTSTTGQANQGKPPQQPNQQQLEKRVQEIDIAYKTYLESQNKFIESFNPDGFNSERIRETVNTKDSSEKLSQLNQAITQLKNEIVPLQTTESNAISSIISDIEKLIQELSDQVISPLKNGLTKDAVAEVQVSLGILPKGDTWEGRFGPNTSSGVEKFLSDKSQKLSGKISQLKQAINSTERAKQQDSIIIFLICSQLITTALLIFLLLIGLRLNKKPGRNQLISKPSPQKSEDPIIYKYQELEVKYNNLENQLKELQRLYQNLSRQYHLINPSQSSQSTENKGINDLYYPEKTSGDSSPKTTESYPKSPLSQPESALTNTNLSSTESQLIQEYNSNPKALLKEVIEVNVRENSRMGSNQPIALEPKKNGSYWVWESGGVCYLIPKYSLKINQYNFETIQYLFNCEGYSSNSQGFKLLKPALVSSSDGNKKWQVSQLGILQFY